MKLKVCGITTIAQLKQLEALGVDYAGFIFYQKSKRYAFEKLRAYQKEIGETGLKKVGVFVNAGMDFIKSCIADFHLSAVQLHGEEPPTFCAELQKNTEVIKVFRIGSATTGIDALVAPFQNHCSYFLFDTDTETYGGSGTRFNWQLLENAKIGKPFFLSGGIGPDAVPDIASFTHPFFYGVDVNSRFETSPGVKNMDLLKTFIAAIKPAFGIANAAAQQL